MTRPYCTPRSWQPFSTLDNVLKQMIEANVGKPCPTRKEIREWTGMPRRRIWPYLEGMVKRGLIEMEIKGGDEFGRGIIRRIRVKDGEWTLWTARRPVMENAA